MKTIKKLLAVLGAISSLISGLFWQLSADAQITAFDKASSVAASNASGVAALSALNSLSITMNQYAAYTAAAAGVLIAISVILED